jgi:dCMP deaminase
MTRKRADNKKVITSSIKHSNLTKSIRRKTSRPDADNYFMKIALVVSERATCRRHSVGAIIVKNRVILATGYNGAPKGAKDCLELGCLRDKLGIPSGKRHEICRAAHAEQNAIIQSTGGLVSTEGATMYNTHSPCNVCAKMMANAGIKEVVVFEKYADQQFKKLFKELGIKIRKIKKPDLSIDFYE